MNEINKKIIESYETQIEELGNELLSYLKSSGRDVKNAIQAYSQKGTTLAKYYAIRDVLENSLILTERSNFMIEIQHELSIVKSTLENENDN